MNNLLIRSSLPPTIAIKLNKIELINLGIFLQYKFQHVESLNINSRITEIILHDLFIRKGQFIEEKTKAKASKPNTLTLKLIEVLSLYQELSPISVSNGVARLILGRIDQALKDAGYNNQTHS